MPDCAQQRGQPAADEINDQQIHEVGNPEQDRSEGAALGEQMVDRHAFVLACRAEWRANSRR